MDLSKILEIVKTICCWAFHSIFVICFFKYGVNAIAEFFKNKNNPKITKELLGEASKSKEILDKINKKIK